jgi:NADH-quinone oxidoreductase subunit D
MDFDIPIGKNGDCYDRYLIRMEEMRQSVGIMKQCIEKLRAKDGQGPVIVQDNKIAPPRRGEMKRSMEAYSSFQAVHRRLSCPGGRSVRCSRSSQR